MSQALARYRYGPKMKPMQITGENVSVQALDSAAAKAPEKPSAPAGPARSVPTYMTSRPEDESRFFGMDWPPSFQTPVPP